MKEILLFAGTTEGRRLSEYLAASDIPHTICVATEYGKLVLKDHPKATVHQGRMNLEEMRAFIQEHDFAAIVDATHPYALAVTENIKAAADSFSIPYFRMRRELDAQGNEESKFDGTVRSETQSGRFNSYRRQYFDSHEACAEALTALSGNVLLTIGSKELSSYSHLKTLKDRLYARVLPNVESISICMEQGVCGKQILALQGPFSQELNEALIKQYQISCIVTKESGIAGGYPEKVKAAKNCGISLFVIGAPKEEGLSFEEICQALEQICQKSIDCPLLMEITLVGIGMGNKKSLTNEALEAIWQADYLFGADRMIEQYHPKIEKKPYYLSKQIISYLNMLMAKQTLSETDKEADNKAIKKTKNRMRNQPMKVVVLLSGDAGFYSGCKSLCEALNRKIKQNNHNVSIRVLPGVSSVSYLAACIGESYDDAAILSIHGKHNWQAQFLHAIRNNQKTFLLTSGAQDIKEFCQLLLAAGLCNCVITAGYQLSYKEQQVIQFSPNEYEKASQKGLYTCLIQNKQAQERRVSPGLLDEQFQRAHVPMTKEEVREVSVCKLQLHENATVYDIGSGTGSIAMEIAQLSGNIKVYAIEKKPEAIELIKRNKDNFQAYNVTIVEAAAPQKFEELPAPTHAFIGGSSGNMREILSALYEKNSTMRVVINAISMETICEIKEMLAIFQIKDENIVQLQVSRAKQAGGYHLMQAQNPVWICSFTFAPSA